MPARPPPRPLSAVASIPTGARSSVSALAPPIRRRCCAMPGTPPRWARTDRFSGLSIKRGLLCPPAADGVERDARFAVRGAARRGAPGMAVGHLDAERDAAIGAALRLQGRAQAIAP